ncbi:MAG: hypothetical protein M3Y65_24930 [Pseudomonadota bacterium]|nr:hypothetical protein [Pseudomonadota bacterium]
MNTLIALLVASLATAGAVLLTQDQLSDIQTQGQAKASLISRLNTNGTLHAATVQWQLDTANTRVPTPEELVAAGYLAPEFLLAQ